MIARLWRRRHAWTLQPIVALRPDVPDPVAAELLYRGPRIGRNLRRWRVWYEQVAALAPDLIATNALDRLQINADSHQLCDDRVHASLAALPAGCAIEWVEHPLRPGSRIRFLDVVDALHALRERGLPVVFDDIGSGEDSLRRFAALAPDEVKFDGHLMEVARTDDRVRAHLRTLVTGYHAQDIRVTIEHVETAADRTTAERIGADRGQGFLWSGMARFAPHAVY